MYEKETCGRQELHEFLYCHYCHSESWLLWSFRCGCGRCCGRRCPCRQSRHEQHLSPIQEGFHVAAVNYVVSKGATEEEDLLSVTLCTRGSTDAYLAKDPGATLLKPQHAWHHPELSSNPKGMGRMGMCESVDVCSQVAFCQSLPSPMGPNHVLAKGLVAHSFFNLQPRVKNISWTNHVQRKPWNADRGAPCGRCD